MKNKYRPIKDNSIIIDMSKTLNMAKFKYLETQNAYSEELLNADPTYLTKETTIEEASTIKRTNIGNIHLLNTEITTAKMNNNKAP
jgi:hypothetical protein